jgi:hypothetical protein
MRSSLAATVMLVVFLLFFGMTGKGQNIVTDTVTIGLTNESLETAIKKIEQQTVFRFFYREQDIIAISHLTLPTASRPIGETLRLLLQNTPILYRQIDKNILLDCKHNATPFAVKGRIISSADGKPVVNASVLLNNATIGDKSSDDGSFLLHGLKPGKYEVVVSCLGYETYSRAFAVKDSDVVLPDIAVLPQVFTLKEVMVSNVRDSSFAKYYSWFSDEFIGTSENAKDCKILNPEVLRLNYNGEFKMLTASSDDFLVIENKALGYTIRYLLRNFALEDGLDKKVFYHGTVLFEEMKGSASETRRWEKNRESVYENSPMHFLNAVLNDRITEEGFRVQQVATCVNKKRPPDSLVDAKLAYYKELKNPDSGQKDSLTYWIKKSRLPKTFQKLMPYALSSKDILEFTGTPDQFALGCDFDALYIAYNKNHRFHISKQFEYPNDKNDDENSVIDFVLPQAIFNSSGFILNPNSLIFHGVWGRDGVADLLPIDYEPTFSDPREIKETARNRENTSLF